MPVLGKLPDCVAVGVIVGVLFVGDGVCEGVAVAVDVEVGVKVAVAIEGIYEIRAGIQSSEKSRALFDETFVMRTRKLLNSPVVHVRPQVSAAPPRIFVVSKVVNVEVVFVAVQVVPPSHESSMHDLGAPVVASTNISSRTSMPKIVEPLGTEARL